MSQGIVIDVQAQVTGYQASLKQLGQALQHIDAGSAIGKQLASAFDDANKQVKALGRNLSQRATSDNQIDAITNRANKAGEAILNIVKLMKRVTSDDVNFSSIQGELDGLSDSLARLNNEFASNMSSGIQKAVADTGELTDAFKKLGIETKELKTPAEFSDAVATKLKEAEKAAKSAQASLTKAANKETREKNILKNLQDSLFNKDDITNQLKTLADQYQGPLKNFKKSLETNLLSMLKGNQVKTDEFIAAFFDGLTPETLQAHLKALKDSVQNILGKDAISASEIYTGLLGDKGKGGNASAIKNALIKQLFPPDFDEQVKQEIKQRFEKVISSIFSHLNDDQINGIKELISKDDLQAAYQNSADAVEEVYSNLEKDIKQQEKKVAKAATNRQAAEENQRNANDTKVTAEELQTKLTQQIERLEKENEDLRSRIDNLEKVIEGRKQEFTAGVKKSGIEGGESSRQFLLGTQEVTKYKTALDQVHSAEQMVGKIQGVVEQWFSIYTAVRMVGNAIKAVISTIQELDATITEIAIVTNMSQSDLWGQMDTYTEMARSYASSISGVYKVSQLYYQQGLQTADVMKLTEQTLKMARISGLDYATATDYMTNAIRSFKMEMQDAQTVVDVYSAVAAASATDTSELASAMSKTASSAQAVGSSFENTTAMMAVMIEATRESAENIGSAMKSIISRYGEMTSDPSALVDSEGEAMSLNRVDKALQTVGITIHDTAGQFRDFDDVIMELASKWDTIDSNTQRYIATIMA